MTMCSNVEDSMRDSIVDCIMQQTNELELLKSMYPIDGEIVITDDYVLRDMENFITNESQYYTPSHLDFVINICINNIKLEICITLPTFYPKEEPDIYVRCNQLNRHQQTSLNNALSEYLTKNHLGEVCLYTAISWLQENTDEFNKENKKVTANKQKSEEKEPIANKFVRMWIYSHHIYSKKKREEIVQRARELKLTGFCLPGKPGVICIEGADTDCKDWWKDIKVMNWQKIAVRKTEEFDQTEQKGYQKFTKFDELIFPNPSTRSSKHADMSQFSKFMEQHGLTQVFNEFFGWCMQ